MQGNSKSDHCTSEWKKLNAYTVKTHILLSLFDKLQNCNNILPITAI